MPNPPLHDQYCTQQTHAQQLANVLGQTYTLVVMKYPGEPDTLRVSIIGGAISPTAPEIWRQHGALVHTLGIVTPQPGSHGRT